MIRQDLVKAITELTIFPEAKGPLCARLRGGGYQFSHDEIDETLLTLEKTGEIVKFKRGKVGDYYFTRKDYNGEKK